MRSKWQQAGTAEEHGFYCKDPQSPNAGKLEENVCSAGFAGDHFCCCSCLLTHIVIGKIRMHILPNDVKYIFVNRDFDRWPLFEFIHKLTAVLCLSLVSHRAVCTALWQMESQEY